MLLFALLYGPVKHLLVVVIVINVTLVSKSSRVPNEGTLLLLKIKHRPLSWSLTNIYRANIFLTTQYARDKSHLIFTVMSLVCCKVLIVPESRCLIAVNVSTDGAELKTVESAVSYFYNFTQFWLAIRWVLFCFYRIVTHFRSRELNFVNLKRQILRFAEKSCWMEIHVHLLLIKHSVFSFSSLK